jgi:hypothetical protein
MAMVESRGVKRLRVVALLSLGRASNSEVRLYLDSESMEPNMNSKEH